MCRLHDPKTRGLSGPVTAPIAVSNDEPLRTLQGKTAWSVIREASAT